MYFMEYETPIIGVLTLATDGLGITGCWFDNDRYFGYGVDGRMERCDRIPVFDAARGWLDRYFAGDAPDPRELPLSARATDFQARVREAMLDIPYGETTTYGAIAKRLESETGKRQSARAVGGAVGRNPLCLIVPCHRVLGANGNLTGFGGGIDTKVKLLEHEHAMRDTFKRPRKGTALCGVPNASRAGRGGDYSFGDLSTDDMYAILELRDESFADVFVAGATTTGTYCRPGCTGDIPLRADCRFFATGADAQAAGFRACARCGSQDGEAGA